METEMKAFAQTVATESIQDLKAYYTNYSNAQLELMVATVRFIGATVKFSFYVLMGFIFVMMVPPYGFFLLALYLWGEMKLGETLSMRWRIVFWVITIPLALTQWIVFTYAITRFVKV